MIRVERVPEPQGFDARVRQRGAAWLKENPSAERPRAYWLEFADALAEGFGHRCGYTAMHTMSGDVDHYRAFRGHEHLAYEWDNYRYADGRFNSAKGKKAIVDPYEMGEGWFEVQLPTLHMHATERVPPQCRAEVEATLRDHDLRDGERVVRTRLFWYREHLRGTLTLPGLCRYAPLVGEAVERWLRTRPTLPVLSREEFW